MNCNKNQVFWRAQNPCALQYRVRACEPGRRRQLTLLVDGGDDISYDHADWADAKIVMNEGRPLVEADVKEEAVILTPKPSPQPRINSAKVFGVCPGAPFLFTVAATGERPIKFSGADCRAD